MVLQVNGGTNYKGTKVEYTHKQTQKAGATGEARLELS